MKRKLRALSFFALSVFLIVSCNKYNKMLDWENMEIDGNMNWGIPLINADYSMEKILDQFGDMDFIKYESNGNFYFEYTIDEQEFVNVDDFNSIPEATQTFNLDFLMSPSFGAPKATMEQTFPGNTIDISTEDVRINTATLNSGSIKIDFSHISMPANVDYDAYIKSKTLFYANGAPFLEQVSKSNPTRLVNATGLKVVADDSQLDFEIRIVLRITGTPPMGILPFNPEFSLINLKIKEAEVELLKEFAYPITNNSAFSLFSHNLSLDATVYGAKLDLNLTNTFGFDVRMKLAKAYLKERNHTQSILLEDNSVITIPRNHTGVYSISDRIKNEIRLTTTYDSLAFEFIPFLD